MIGTSAFFRTDFVGVQAELGADGFELVSVSGIAPVGSGAIFPEHRIVAPPAAL